MTWLTMTPMRLVIPRIARKPIGIPITQILAKAPTAPNGMAAKTMNGLIAFLNWKTSAR
jgi:hypothetical protein